MNKKEEEQEDLKRKVEALLFSSVKGIKIEDIAKLCNTREVDLIRELVEELRDEYDSNKSSLMIVTDATNTYWRFSVREQHVKVIRKVVTKTELTKTLMETLAVIAHKAPVKQSDVIKIRTNKAYDHIRELIDKGYITSEKFGKTKLLKLSSKFYDYFDTSPDKLKQKFEKFEGVEKELLIAENDVLQKKKALSEPRKQSSDITSEQALPNEEKKEKVLADSSEPKIDVLPSVADETQDEKSKKEENSKQQ